MPRVTDDRQFVFGVHPEVLYRASRHEHMVVRRNRVQSERDMAVSSGVDANEVSPGSKGVALYAICTRKVDLLQTHRRLNPELHLGARLGVPAGRKLGDVQEAHQPPRSLVVPMLEESNCVALS